MRDYIFNKNILQKTFESYECLLSISFINMIEIKGVSNFSRRLSKDYFVFAKLRISMMLSTKIIQI